VPRVSAVAVKIREKTDREAPLESREGAFEAPIRLKASGQFERGQSGNPNGRPPGSRNRGFIRLEQILHQDAERVVQRIIEAAISGDMCAAKLILDRVLPKTACRPRMEIVLPELRTADDARTLVSTVLAAAIRGDISTVEAGDVARAAEIFARITGISELQAKVQMLEERLSEARS
jgi:Family of unknown function (DUF5681)